MKGAHRSEELRTRFGLASFLLVTLVQATVATAPHGHSVRISAPYASYVCPEGATVRLTCSQRGAEGAGAGERGRHPWRFTPDMDQDCHAPVHPRRNASRYAARGELFWVELTNVTRGDQGRYCCLSLGGRGHGGVQVVAHSHVTLTVVTRRTDSLNCSHWSSPAPEGTVTAGLATAACIMAILSLPLILLLVYRQKHSSRSSRRAHELVRMDSQGHENPVYGGSPPQGKGGRSVAQIMTRQPSETGRHLLAEPGTPLSPPDHGEVFFPSHDPIPEGPDFMQV